MHRVAARGQELITKEVWDGGERATGKSVRKALMSYGWDKKEQPKKDGREDPLDALRYDCITWRWADSIVDQRQYQPRSSASMSRRVKVGGAKRRSF